VNSGRILGSLDTPKLRFEADESVARKKGNACQNGSKRRHDSDHHKDEGFDRHHDFSL
jgi:hypothetical protein